jgi:hypothetical protein
MVLRPVEKRSQEWSAELQMRSSLRQVEGEMSNSKVVVESRTGAPRSPQRTWAENGIFQMLFLNRQETIHFEKKQRRGCAHFLRPTYAEANRISCYAPPERAACAVFCKENRMKIATSPTSTGNPGNVGHPSPTRIQLDRRPRCSSGAKPRDLQFARSASNAEGSRRWLCK